MYKMLLVFAVSFTSYGAWFNIQPSDSPNNEIGVVINTDVKSPSMCLIEYNGKYSIYKLERRSDGAYTASKRVSGPVISQSAKKVNISIISDTKSVDVEISH